MCRRNDGGYRAFGADDSCDHMTELRQDRWTMPAARLGPENPLPPLRGVRSASAVRAPGIDELPDYPDKGNEASILPYRLLSEYDRVRRRRDFDAIVLENDALRATFLPGVGGRLWSLVDKRSGRQLLHVNPVFQPANLALRDAWISGGVEWNISILGHSPFTVSPLFAARVTGPDGAPALRLYEFERARCVVFQIDCFLREDVPFLFARVRIINPNDAMVAMYWWSNIAVDERPDVRVLAPADKAWRHDYDGRLVMRDVPVQNGVDVTYPRNRVAAGDVYFCIPEGRRPWIAALDGAGRGLVHASTRRLFGRKLWTWGMGRGGRRWQEFLSQRGSAYIEIQGGLARTQGEYVAMPAGAQWSWLEAYGLLETDAQAVHGADWHKAVAAAERRLGEMLPADWMEQELQRTQELADRPPEQVLYRGSGWGALENIRRRKAGEPALAPPALVFDETTLGEEQSPWLALLNEGQLPYRPPHESPGSYMVQPQWRKMLEEALAAGRGDHWLSWLHAGVMRYRAGDIEGARAAWNTSMQREPSAWALRNLAVLESMARNHSAAAELYMQAAALAPEVVPLAVECCASLYEAGRYAQLRRLAASAPPPVRSDGRVRMLAAMAALKMDDLEAVEEFFRSGVDATHVREAEVSLTTLWFEWQEKRLSRAEGRAINDDIRQRVRRDYPPPPEIDFRMTPDR